jgi:hypothetical protein
VLSVALGQLRAVFEWYGTAMALIGALTTVAGIGVAAWDLLFDREEYVVWGNRIKPRE